MIVALPPKELLDLGPISPAQHPQPGKSNFHTLPSSVNSIGILVFGIYLGTVKLDLDRDWDCLGYPELKKTCKLQTNGLGPAKSLAALNQTVICAAQQWE